MKKLYFIYLVFFGSNFLLAQPGNALDFDGSNDDVSTNYGGISGTNSRTIEAWVKPFATKNQVIVSYGTDAPGEKWNFSLSSGGTLRTEVNGGHAASTNTISNGIWHHVAVTWENDGTPDIEDVKLYINGVQETLGIIVTEPINTGNSITVKLGYNAVNNNPDPQRFNGEIDEVRIWNIVLTSAQISSIYNDSFSDPTTPAACLEAYYKMTNGSGTSLTDNSGNGNTGTLNNGTTWVSSSAGVTAQTAPTCASLPVEISYFRVKTHTEGVKLSWETASEVENKGFEIEHSIDTRNWVTLDFVPGQGTSFETQNYSFLHHQPVNGINYYRLKQIDYDGAFEYSEMKSVMVIDSDGQPKFQVFPNPVKNGAFNLYLPEVEVVNGSMQLLDYSGRMIWETVLYENQTIINTDNLISGTYLIRVQHEGKIFWERLVIL